MRTRMRDGSSLPSPILSLVLTLLQHKNNMQKSVKQLLALLLIGSFALSFSSCKDSENVSDDPNSPENLSQSKESETAQALLSILSFTSEMDSLPDNWASNSFTVEPTVGIINDASTPYVRYIPVRNKEEAITKYNSFANEGIDENEKSSSWNIENVGSMTFNVLDQTDVTATLDINIKQQPHLTQIRFVPASALGSNASVKEDPYYSFGDIVYLQEGQNHSYWVCVRPCSKLDNKETSHWLSFQLNDWEDDKYKMVKSGSVNFKRLHSTGYQDYYLPDNLGDESGGREHLQNLFRLLMVLNNPNKYGQFSQSGLGSNNPAELTQDMVSTISQFWEDNDNAYWKRILPEKVSRADIHNAIENEQEVNVFYKGFSSTPAVYLAKLAGDNLEFLYGTKNKKNDKITWTREKGGVDFHDYAKWGLQQAEVNANNKKIKELPDKGFIVRYKTGAQLVGSWGNDDDYKHSFTLEHSNIKDVYVYNQMKKTADIGASVMGDIIENPTTESAEEYCVLNNSKDAPEYWSNSSFYLSPWSPESGTSKLFLQNKKISKDAYIHLLTALMLNSKEYDAYVKTTGEGALQVTQEYKDVVDNLFSEMNDEFSFDEKDDMSAIVDFKTLDSNFQEFTVTSGNISRLTYFRIKFPYADPTYGNEQFRMAYLYYNMKKNSFMVKDEARLYKSYGNFLYNLKAYKDIRTSKPIINENQTFRKIVDENRQSYKKASINYLNNVKIE